MSSRPKPWYSERVCPVCTRSASSFCRDPLYSFVHAMRVIWWYPHSMRERVERVTAKTGRTSCTNWTNSSGVSGFWTTTHLLHEPFIFLNLFELQTFLRSICTIQSEVINFQHVLTSFAIFQSFTDLFRELNDHEIENQYKMNSENVETWHGNIISPKWHVQNSREGYDKN